MYWKSLPNFINTQYKNCGSSHFQRYQKAKERVLFEGFEVMNQQGVYLVHKDGYSIWSTWFKGSYNRKNFS